MKRALLVLSLLASTVAGAVYMPLAKLTSAGTSVSTTVPAGHWVGLQCDGLAWFAFGSSSATAVTDSGLKIFADQPPVDVKMLPGQDKVAMISDSGTVHCWVTDATR